MNTRSPVTAHWLRSGLLALRVRDRWPSGQLVMCPEARATALVQTAPDGSVQRCSRWPGRGDCDTSCQRVPAGSLLERVVEEWYGERPCAGCGQSFDTLDWDARAPALRRADGGVVRWGDLDPADFVGILAAHDPLCAACAGPSGTGAAR